MCVALPNKKFFLLLLIFSAYGHTHAQVPRLGFEHLTMEQGLPENVVIDILFDSKGYLWAATTNGLSRYDGYSFTNYKFDEAGEEALTAWMKKHLGLGFCELAELTVHELEAREKSLIRSVKPPLNILNNPEGPYRSRLESARKHCATLARGGA